MKPSARKKLLLSAVVLVGLVGYLAARAVTASVTGSAAQEVQRDSRQPEDSPLPPPLSTVASRLAGPAIDELPAILRSLGFDVPVDAFMRSAIAGDIAFSSASRTCIHKETGSLLQYTVSSSTGLKPMIYYTVKTTYTKDAIPQFRLLAAKISPELETKLGLLEATYTRTQQATSAVVGRMTITIDSEGISLRCDLPSNDPFLVSKPSSATEDSVRCPLRFDGVYQSEEMGQSSWRYLRFYEDGTVLAVSSTGKPEEVVQWLNKENLKLSHGTYAFGEDWVAFTAIHPEGATVDYAVLIQGAVLYARYYSHTTGWFGEDSFRLVSGNTN